MTILIPQKAATAATVRRRCVLDAGASMDRHAAERDRTSTLALCKAELRDRVDGRRTCLRLCVRQVKPVVDGAPIHAVLDAPQRLSLLQTNRAMTDMQHNLDIGSVASARPHSLKRSI